nr:helix-turn-helix domain-containing protein [Vibrio zhanjiangensis]
MSDRDINRFKVLQYARERRLRQVDAADILNISPRQVRRFVVSTWLVIVKPSQIVRWEITMSELYLVMAVIQ